MRVFILTEGSLLWGLGHLNRCLAFASELEKRGHLVQWIVMGDDIALQFAKQSEIGHFNLDSWCDTDNIESMIGPAELVVVDSYHCPLQLYENIAAVCPRCLWIDDEARIDYPKGYVLNPNPMVKQRHARDGENGFHLLSGFKYQPLRPAFSSQIPMRVFGNSIDNILVMMGGTDIRELTPFVVGSILQVYPNAKITVIVADDQKRCEWAIENPNMYFLGAQSCTKIIELMVAADVFISAGGQTICESSVLGLPTLAIGVVENQEKNLQTIADAGAVLFVGLYSDNNLKEKLIECLNLINCAGVRALLSKRARSLYDGRGVSRALDSIGV